MAKTVRIGGACAFYGDSSVAPTQLINAGVDYLILDYLAEATMSALGSMKRHRADLGYAADFTEWVWKDNLAALKATGTKIVTNAGGVNPKACVERMQAIAAEAGYDFRIAYVEGDDLLGRLDEIADQTEMFTHAPFPPRDKIVTANAYLGGGPIAHALAMGADMVITGRCVDSALTLGICIHEFGWKAEDYDKLSQASLAGHVIECGAQGSGGLFTDWEAVPDWENIGYPIVECQADGSFVVTKPEGSGGLVNKAVVAEQILYEVGDPQAYLLPDVACDFTEVQLEQVGENRVRVTGSIGRAPTGKYKVCVTWEDGFRCMGFMTIVGRDAAKKAQRQAEAVLARCNRMLRDRNMGPYRTSRIELIGAESSYGAHARGMDTREVVYKLAAEHDDADAFKPFLREFDSPTTSMSVGTAGWFGARAQVTSVSRVFSVAIPRDQVPATITLGSKVETITEPVPAKVFDPAAIVRPAAPAEPVADGELVEVPLVSVAWGRSGDKGDAFNIGVIARKPEALPWIRAALSPEAMLSWFAHEFEGGAHPAVLRYDLPGLNAVNLHFLDALGGGQFASLRLDPLAKGKAQQLLDMPVKVPAHMVA
ncbi:DUF1446 domain-containing protein [Novosphingobium sp. KCTC 2891]|uniref:acyclic terpene utilization AtuA family protein n=1 Tax=Novosphingobium sp. KCTC 2891 TaxID=2989730 RepID=UPI002222CC7E|nr:acyclic terpene utilization AtuA family protein [Novosphingobium sp. KCTC 2891]MCW1382726.1 DUF1446 domain-containing protein [Novosphingobium sp. KCTC 2891]